jgi:AcrR family transcriptional regulator
VSEPTFFAHFTSKSQLLAYHICLWRIGTTMAASRHPDGAAFLRAFFTSTAESILDGPRLWFEITAEVARGAGLCEILDISDAERLLVFDDEAALGVPITPQADLFANHLAAARQDGRPGLDVSQSATALLAAFYGVPLALGPGRLGELASAYHCQLDRILASGKHR